MDIDERERNLMNDIKRYIINRANKEFGYAGLAEYEDGCIINTGDSKTLKIKIDITA